ncbi:hypothetical protein EV127DRAFT_505132 [Xylaria flabelliformis]|nr:hypothetical protein EV127DRAFT_505132 [Xylaria flabelliformis]
MDRKLVRVWQKITAYFSRRNNPTPHDLSPQGNPRRYPQLSKLASDVKTNCLKGGRLSNERFLPNDKLEDLVTKGNLQLALQETTIEQEDHEDLTTWVLDRGKRLFLILVLLSRDSEEHLSKIEHLKNDGIDDSKLPLCFSQAEPYYGYSLEAEVDGAQRFHSFKNWDDNDLILFKAYQWIFLAPIFGSSIQFRHQLHNEQPLPLLNVAKPEKRGVLGEIECGEIHPAHIDSRCLSTLGVNESSLQVIPVFIKIVLPSDNIHPFFDMDTGNFKASHPIISPEHIKPIAAYRKSSVDFIIFQHVDLGPSVMRSNLEKSQDRKVLSMGE